MSQGEGFAKKAVKDICKKMMTMHPGQAKERGQGDRGRYPASCNAPTSVQFAKMPSRGNQVWEEGERVVTGPCHLPLASSCKGENHLRGPGAHCPANGSLPLLLEPVRARACLLIFSI